MTRTLTRALANLPQNIVSVKDFGAVGDGVANDTAAIQAALNSGAADVFFPKATAHYSVTTLSVPPTVRRIAGLGTIKQRAVNSGSLFSITSSNGCTFEGLRLEGAWGNNLNASPSSDNIAILATSCANVKVINCYFTRIGSICVRLVNSSDCLISGNASFECGPGIYVRGSNRVSIVNNIINKPITDDTVFTIGISLESTDGHAYGINRDIVIDGNVVKAYKNAQGIMAHSVIRCSISNNVVNESIIGISLNPFNAADYLSNVSVTGNSVYGLDILPGYSGGDDGIVCQAGPGTPDITDLTISGNTVSNFNRVVGHPDQAGIRVGYTKRVVVSSNVITSCRNNGISLVDAEDSITVDGNVISDIIAGSAQNGIYCKAALKGVLSNNLIKNLNGGSGVGIQLSTVSGVRLEGNHYSFVDTFVANGQYEQALLYKEITTVGASVTIDLSGVDLIVFNQASPSTITGFTGVVVGKLYKFFFSNGNTTIDRSNAFLNGSANQTGTADDVMLVYGRTSTTISQAAPMSVNG